MPNIKPVSDLRNYSSVLNEVSVNDPVYLTKNGRGCYAVVDLHEWDKQQATLKLLAELAKAERASESEGWLTMEEVEKALGI